MDINYVQMYLKSGLLEKEPLALLSLTVLGLGRVLPIITLAPFFGARVLPHPVKFAIGILLTTIAMPTLLTTITTPIAFNARLVGLFLKEMLVGTMMGFFVGVPFFIISSAGVFTDHQRGAASFMSTDPTLQGQSSPLGTFYNLFMITIFYAIDGPFYVMNAILDSYQLLPLDSFLDAKFFAPASLLREKFTKLLQLIVELSLQLCAPALLSILMTDLFLGIINRMAPQVQITFLGMGLKSWLAILMVCIGWDFLVGQMSIELRKWLQEFNMMIREFTYGKPVETIKFLPPSPL